jgi:hypothetical protein
MSFRGSSHNIQPAIYTNESASLHTSVSCTTLVAAVKELLSRQPLLTRIRLACSPRCSVGPQTLARLGAAMLLFGPSFGISNAQLFADVICDLPGSQALNLEILSFTYKGLTPHGIRLIAAGLVTGRFSILRDLHLDNNGMGLEGARRLAVALRNDSLPRLGSSCAFGATGWAMQVYTSCWFV